MKSLFTLLGILTFVFVFSQNIEEGEAKNIKEFYNIALSEQQAYKWLDHLCNEIGPRPAGSDNADKAAKWAKSELEKIGLDNGLSGKSYTSVKDAVTDARKSCFSNDDSKAIVCGSVYVVGDALNGI